MYKHSNPNELSILDAIALTPGSMMLVFMLAIIIGAAIGHVYIQVYHPDYRMQKCLEHAQITSMPPGNCFGEIWNR